MAEIFTLLWAITIKHMMYLR